MPSLEVAHLSYALPDGRSLFERVSFRVGAAEHAALIGTNGCGKSTLLRTIAGEVRPASGTVTIDGELAVMPQLVGMRDDTTTVRALLLEAAPERLRTADLAVRRAEQRMTDDAVAGGLAYAEALAGWQDAGGYETEVIWDECATRAVGSPFSEVADRPLHTFSGGEQKRIALEYLFRNEAAVLLLDEPDNFLDVPGKQWLAEQIRSSQKTILLVTHDRELLAQAAGRLVTIEGGTAWVHGGGFDGWAAARQARRERIDD